MTAARSHAARRTAFARAVRAGFRATTLALATVSASSLLAGAARADTVTLFPIKDNTLYETSAGNLSNGAGQRMFAGRTLQSTDSRRRALVRFPVPGPIPAGATITSVELHLFCDQSGSGPTSLTAVVRVLADWGEGASNAGLPGGMGTTAQPGDATWTDRFYPATTWTSPGGDFIGSPSAVLSVTPSGAVTIASTPSLVSDVQYWLDNPGVNFGWMLLGDELNGGSVNRFYTREMGTAGPSLVVNYIPKATPAEAATWGVVKGLYR